MCLVKVICVIVRYVLFGGLTSNVLSCGIFNGVL